MTTRDEFEEFMKDNGCGHILQKEFGSYVHAPVFVALDVWEARQQEIDALKAEIQRLKSKDHIRDTTKMILPPEISRQLLGKIVDEVFSGAIEDVEVIEDIYRVIAEHQLEHKLNMVPADNKVGREES